MAGFDSTNLGGLALNVYSKERLKELHNLESPLLARVKDATSFTVGGNGFFFGAKTQVNNSGRFSDPDGQVPAAQRFVVQQPFVVPRTYFITCEVTGLAKELATGQPYSFVSLMGESIEDAARSAATDHEVALFGDNTGKLADVLDVNGSVITVDNPSAFRIGQVLDSINTGGTAVQADMTVTNVDWQAGTITVNTIGSTTAGNGLYKADTQAGAGSFAARSFDALKSGVSDSGEYLGLDRSVHPRWASNVIPADSPLDEDVIEQSRNLVHQESGHRNMRGFTAILHPRQERAAKLVMYSRLRYSGTSATMGLDSIGIAGLDVAVSSFAPENAVYAGDMSEFRRFKTPNGDLQISTDFGDAWKFVPNFEKGQAVLRSYSNYVITNPKSWVKIDRLDNSLAR